MVTPKIRTFHEVTPFIYSWTTPDIPKYKGWEKIGYTEQPGGPDARIAQQASQLSVRKEKLWALRAFFQTERGGRFTDRDFHAYLKKQGVEREHNPTGHPRRTEWHNFTSTPHTSKEYFQQFASQDPADSHQIGDEDYNLRPEQADAVAQAMTAFQDGHSEVLWNAKPRFGKTLTTYDLIRNLDVRYVLIVTNRPAIANSWLDDFRRFIQHQTSFVFVSESSSLQERVTMSREDWTRHAINSDDPRLIEFLSLQDLKGSEYFGGHFKKLKHIVEINWGLLVIDEAHEGIDTTKTDIAFNQISRKFTLHLSGTPFKALASNKFSQQQIFNWTYKDEQLARTQWSDESLENPYSSLPQLNMLTYQVSRMITKRLAEGVASSEDEANIDYAFNLNEFFRTKENGVFEHYEDVVKFLDCLTQNEKYPFSTPELRNEIRHSFWLLDRVASAKALERLLKKHEIFGEYKIILAAGDGKSDGQTNAESSEQALARVQKAIKSAEEQNGKTITLSVGQLTTGVTVPEWTAVLMLSNISSPSLYMQAAFRAQNPHTFQRGERVLQKENAYIFDFAPERTLTIFDELANNLHPNSSGDPNVRQDNIRRLLNFFPILGEDSEGKMIELDASQVLTFPQIFKAKEVIRRGFLSNLLFDNVAGIFRYSEQITEILEKLPEASEGKIKTGSKFAIEEPRPTIDKDGNVKVDYETVINPKILELGPPVWSKEEVSEITSSNQTTPLADELACLVTKKTMSIRARLKEEYKLSDAQLARDTRKTEQTVKAAVERALTEKEIAKKHLEDRIETVTTDEDWAEIQQQEAASELAFRDEIVAVLEQASNSLAKNTIQREETKKEQKRANSTMDKARSHLRGFARTIPLFLMAYGQREMRLSNFDEHTPDAVFHEITGITEEEFRTLRDGQEIVQEDGQVVRIPGLFDEMVFDQSIQEFLDKKEELANYFDDSLTENIFAYIPAQRSSLVFTPQLVVNQMIDLLEEDDPAIFKDPNKTFADVFSTAGLFLMELVRRLDTGLSEKIPDQQERLKHILTNQLFEMSHNQILHDITLESVSGGLPSRKKWMHESGHFRVGNIANLTADERIQVLYEFLEEA